MNETIAEEHAEWYSKHIAQIAKIIYKDAFEHGYKHGKEWFDDTIKVVGAEEK